MKRGVKRLKAKEQIAPSWKRFLAFIIDILILDLVVSSPWVETLEALVPTDFFAASLPIELTYIMVMLAVLYITYFTVLQVFYQQTIGQMLFRLYIAPLEKKKPLMWWKVLLSHLWILPIVPFVFLWILDPLFAIFTKTKQRLSQKVVGIITIEKRLVP